LIERFDTLIPPLLPAGWSSSGTRDPGGDFGSTPGGAASAPNALIGTNSTVEQWLTLPPVDLTDWSDLTVAWDERRSASHDSHLGLEARSSPGAPFLPLPGALFDPPGSTAYVARLVHIPRTAEGSPEYTLRLKVTGDGSGASGTIRLDNVAIDGRPRWDLSLSIPHPVLRIPSDGGPPVITGMVLNRGFGESQAATVDLFVAEQPGSGKWTFSSSEDLPPLPEGDSAAVDFTIVPAAGGETSILMVCTAGHDQVRANDSATALVRVPAAPGSVVINEIMYDPLPGRGEFVEFLNVTPSEIDLRSWVLADREDDPSPVRFPDETLPLPPGGFLLCSPDTGIAEGYTGIPPGTPVLEGMRSLSLINGGTVLTLSDENGQVIDRLEYSPGWNTPAVEDPSGRSLERIDAASPGGEAWNWGSSPDPSGSTPGRPNLLAAAHPTGGGGEIEFHPNPFSPDGDGFEEVTEISFRTDGAGALVRVRIFDAWGRPVRTLTRSAYVAGRSSMIWNGYDDAGRRAAIGIYVVLVEGVDAGGKKSFAMKGAVVLAGRL